MTSPPNIAGYWEETEESFDKDIPGLVTSVTYFLRIAQDGDIVQIDDHGDRRQGRITRLENNLVHIELGTAEQVVFDTTTHRFTIPRQRFYLFDGPTRIDTAAAWIAAKPVAPALAHYLFPDGQPRVPAPLFTRFPNLRVYRALTSSDITLLAWLGADRVAITLSTAAPDDTPQRIARDYNITQTAHYFFNDDTLTESDTALESPPHSSAPAPDTSLVSPRTAS